MINQIKKCVKFMLVCVRMCTNIVYGTCIACSLIDLVIITHKCSLTIPANRTQLKQ